MLFQTCEILIHMIIPKNDNAIESLEGSPLAPPHFPFTWRAFSILALL
jgi:hypothetical protein